MPSELEPLFWRYTHQDLTTRLRLFLGEKQAEAIQAYQSLALVAGQIFGSEKKGSKPEAEVPQTAAELQVAFNAVFGKR